MAIWSSEIKELEKLYESLKGQFPDLEKELEQLIRTEDANVIMLYSRRCLEVIITDLCECELKRPRKTEPLKGIIDKLHKEEKVPSHIIASMHGLNELSTYGTHPKDFDPIQVKPVLVNLAVIIKWYEKYKDSRTIIEAKSWGEPTDSEVKTSIDQTIGKVQTSAERNIGEPKIKVIRELFRKLRMIYVLPVGLFLALVIFFIFSSGSSLPFFKRDWVIVTDFENLTGNPVFDKSLYTAFTLSTNQSRYINVFPRSRMLETLTRMEIKNQTFIDEKTGREIAIREGIKLYIVPSISEVGNSYAITAKIMETQSGNLLKSEILYPETQDEILSRLDKLSKKIRHDLGESLYDIAMQGKHLEKVTTSSLEALRLYTLGIEKNAKSDFEEARDYYEDALRIDTGFTAARASLGVIYMEKFDPVRGRELLIQAVKTVNRLTTRERLAILGFYAINVENNYPKGIEYERMRIELYPDDPAARNNMGWYYQHSGQFEKAVKEYKEAIRINPNMPLAYGGLLETYLQLMGDADSALVWAKKMIIVSPQNVWSHNNLGSAWICFDSISKAIFHFRKAREINPRELFNLHWLAHACHRQKLFDEAIQTLNQILEINKSEGSVYYYLGVNYQSMGNQEEALKYFSSFKKIVTEDWMKNFPNDAETYFWQGAVSARLGDMDYSQQMLLKAIKIDSTRHERSAELLCTQGKIPEALDELGKAFENGYRDLVWLKLSPDLEILQYDIRFRDLMDKYFKFKTNVYERSRNLLE
jgi:tetratricopeptide (TPR) repeat protein